MRFSSELQALSSRHGAKAKIGLEESERTSHHAVSVKCSVQYPLHACLFLELFTSFVLPSRLSLFVRLQTRSEYLRGKQLVGHRDIVVFD